MPDSPVSPRQLLRTLGASWIVRAFELARLGDPNLRGYPRTYAREIRELQDPCRLAAELELATHSACEAWPELPVRLPAPLPPSDLPTRETGPIRVVHVFDPGHPGASTARLDGWEALAAFHPLICWETVLAPARTTAQADSGWRASCLLQATAELAPHAFDDAADALSRAYLVANANQVERLLSSVDLDLAAVASLAASSEVQEAVGRQRHVARVHGVPPGEPRFVVDERVLGSIEELEDEVAILAMRGP